jgi:hypothetical protein
MLAHNMEGKLCLEDADGSVVLDLARLVWFVDIFVQLLELTLIKEDPGEGLYAEGCIALVEGEYTEEGMLEVVAMGQPPCEDRETARSDTLLQDAIKVFTFSRSIYGHIDFLGKGSTTLLEDVRSPLQLRCVINRHCGSLTLPAAFEKSSRTFTSLFYLMSGLTIPKPSLGFKKCSTTVSRIASSRRSSSCVGTSRVDQ